MGVGRSVSISVKYEKIRAETQEPLRLPGAPEPGLSSLCIVRHAVMTLFVSRWNFRGLLRVFTVISKHSFA